MLAVLAGMPVAASATGDDRPDGDVTAATNHVDEALDRPDGVWDPSPAPGSLLAPGTVTVGARVVGRLAADVPVRLEVDGTAVPASTTVQRDGRAVAADLALSAGTHTIRVSATTRDGDVLSRSWDVVLGGPTLARLHGTTRVATALAIADAAMGGADTAPTAVLARADAFADALAGVPLAAHLGGPLLLTGRDALDPAVADRLATLLPRGAPVVLLGGTAALSETVAGDLRALGLSPRRVRGDDRYATAAAVAAELPSHPRAFVASGTSFPDALAASVPAARDGSPVLLTRPDTVPAATRAALARREVRDLVVVGGTAAVAGSTTAALHGAGRDVRRVAGADRWDTAVAVAEAFFGPALRDDLGPDEPTPPPPTTVALANGVRFPDALAGAQHAATVDAPLLLTRPHALPDATVHALHDLAPTDVVVYGGAAAVAANVLVDVRRGVVGSPDAPRLLATDPAAGRAVTRLDRLRLTYDVPVELDDVDVHVTLGGLELPGTLAADPADSRTVVFVPRVPALSTSGVGLPVSVVTRTRAPGGGDHLATGFTFRSVAGVFARVGPVELHLPSPGTEIIGFHQSLHDGALHQSPATDAPVPWVTMPSRGRDTDRHGAADIAADPAAPIVAPVSGIVKRAGSYTLYCDFRDHYLVVAPDAAPDWEVKLLHFEGLAVARGDRVEAGRTVVGSAPRLFPFSSQVDRFSGPQDWPHVHLEVVDPSIPDRPSPGGGC